MRSAKLSLLGMLAAGALGVLAFAPLARAAEDVSESGFFIDGAQAGTLKASLTAKQLGRGTLSIPALKIEVNCEKFTLTSGSINSTTDGEAQLLYEECTVLTNEGAKLEEAFGCEIVANHEGGVQKHHITATGLFLPAALKDGTPAILAEKLVAKVLTKPESGCFLPKTTEIKGELCLKVEKNHTAEPELVTSEEIQGLCNARLTLEGNEVSGSKAEIEKLEAENKAFLDKLLFGVNEAFVTVKADVSLGGAHAGKTLGVLSGVTVVTEDVLESGFFINGAQAGTLKASLTAKQLGRGTLSIPSLKTEVNCEKFTLTSGTINSTTDGEAQLLYEECTVLTNEGAKLEESPGCEIVANHEGGVQKHHITATALLLPAELKDGTPGILAEKLVAKVLTKPEVGCLLPKTTEIKGELCLKVEKNHTAEPELVTSEEIQGLCKARLDLEETTEVQGTGAGVEKLETEGKAFLDKLLFGFNEAFVTAKTDVSLSGAHAGKTLGVLLVPPHVKDALGSGFFINGSQAEALKASLTASQLGRGTLSIPALGFEINCEKFTIKSGLVSTTTDAEATLLYEECTVLTREESGGKIILEEIVGCEIVTNHEGGVQKHHITVTALFLPAELKDGTPAVLAENIVDKMLIKQGLGCTLPKTFELTGEICLKVEKNHTTEPELVTNEEIQGLCRAKLTLNGTVEVEGPTGEIEKLETESKAFLDEFRYGTNPGFITGKAAVALVGAHQGKTLGVLLI